MCTVSMIAKDWFDRNPWQPAPIPTTPYYPLGPQNPGITPNIPNNQPPFDWSTLFVQPITREEFDALKAELAAVKELLKAAKIYDEKTGQKDCEDPEKVALFRRLAEITGVSMEDVFPQPEWRR
jgi:hypothetical protein